MVAALCNPFRVGVRMIRLPRVALRGCAVSLTLGYDVKRLRRSPLLPRADADGLVQRYMSTLVSMAFMELVPR